MPTLVVATAVPALLGFVGGPLHVHAQTQSARERDEAEDRAEKAKAKAKDEAEDQRKHDDGDDEDDDDDPSTPAPVTVPGPTLEHGLVAPVTATRTVSGVDVNVDVPQAGSPLPFLPAALLGAGGSLLLVAGRRMGRARG